MNSTFLEFSMLSNNRLAVLNDPQPRALSAPVDALIHNVISFHFKAHPRFLEAASFEWPSASWHFVQ